MIQIINQLINTPSTKEKELILKANSDNEKLITLLKLNLNPYILFYIDRLPEIEEIEVKLDSNQAYNSFITLTNNLKERLITGNKAREAIKELFSKLNKDDFELYKKILLKESIGVGTKTVNKVWTKLIPEFKVMLASSEQADIMSINYPTLVEPKLDGFRTLVLPYMQPYSLYSRSGLQIQNKRLIEHFKALQNISEYVLDGELYHHTIGFQELSSILNSEDKKVPKDLKYVIYDIIPVEDWLKEDCKLQYKDRLKLLREIVTSRIADHMKIVDIACDEVYSSKELVEIYKNYLHNGYEGIMIKKPTGLYQWKRVANKSEVMLKYKPFKSADLEVISIYAGEGNFTGLAGGINCEFNSVPVAVGSGFDLVTRKAMADQPSKFIGKVAEIKYFEETEEGSLRFPTFMRWREDK